MDHTYTAKPILIIGFAAVVYKNTNSKCYNKSPPYQTHSSEYILPVQVTWTKTHPPILSYEIVACALPEITYLSGFGYHHILCLVLVTVRMTANHNGFCPARYNTGYALTQDWLTEYSTAENVTNCSVWTQPHFF